MSKWADRMHRLRLQLIGEMGGRCMAKGCTQTDPDKLQFAHLKPTKLSGAGRGMSHRLYDVKKNFTSYGLLCEDGCHREFDAGAISIEAHGKVWLQDC